MGDVARGTGHHVHVEELRPLVAEVLLAARARLAVAAGRDERHGHVVADLDQVHTRSDGCDDAGALVAAHEREVGDRQVTGHDVFVRVAHAGEGGLHEHLTRTWIVEGHLLDLPVLLRSPQHGCTGGRRHVFPLGRGRRPLRALHLFLAHSQDGLLRERHAAALRRASLAFSGSAPRGSASSATVGPIASARGASASRSKP